jgi:hypothetical protein
VPGVPEYRFSSKATTPARRASRALLAHTDLVFSQPLALSLPGPPTQRSLPGLLIQR